MSNQVEITITPDRYHISLNRNNSISTRLFCSILRELGIAGLKCDDRYTTLEASPIASDIHIEIQKASVATSRSSDSQGQSLTNSKNCVPCFGEQYIPPASAEWLEFEKNLKRNSIKNEPEWCLIYSYFVLRESNREIDKNTVRNVYKASGRYTKNRSKDFPTNVKKCVERNWLTYDRYNISITEEGLKHVLEHLYCQG